MGDLMRDEIIAIYEAMEAQQGGVGKADMAGIHDGIADMMGIPVSDVREVLIEHFVTLGAG